MVNGADNYIPRGIRNNNPGNIKKNDIQWEGLSDEQTDKTFFQFKSSKWGIRALTKILLTYRHKYGLKNIMSIITRYAPIEENDTEAYKNFVSQETNFGILKELDETIEDYLPVIKAIIKMENGVQPYNDETIIEGMVLAWKK